MISRNEKPFESRALPFVVLLAACCFLVYLASTAKPDVFFSGDAGLKFLILKQGLQNGEFYNIEPHPQQWVNALWAEGFYPFKPPFVYYLAGEHVVTFPPFFQWLSAPFYKYFGYPGLYIVPALSLFLFWCWFVAAMHRWDVKPVISSLGLLVLAFGSPLTLYAAMYWEHTLSVLLAFAGIYFLVSDPASGSRSVILGLLTGCSGLLRPELIVLTVLFSVAAVTRAHLRKNRNGALFAVTACFVIVVYFGFNLFSHGSTFGVHGKQLIDNGNFAAQLQRSLTLLVHLNAKFIAFFPASLLFYSFVLHLLVRRPTVRPVVYQLAVITILYVLIVPFLVPNGGGKQWGPRYFLPLVPLMAVTLCLSGKYLELGIQRFEWWPIALWVLLIPGLYLNSISASLTLSRDYLYRVTPAMNVLKREPVQVVVVQNQYITQEFSAVFGKKVFFLAETQTTLKALLKKMKIAGVQEVIYISSAQERPVLPNRYNPEKPELRQVGTYFFAKYFLW